MVELTTQPDQIIDPATVNIKKQTDKDSVKIVRPNRVSKKKVCQCQLERQGPETGGATSLKKVDGLPTGAGVGYQVDNWKDEAINPPTREPQMGLCTVQLVRVPEAPIQPEIERVGQLWWVAPATERAIKETLIGPDVTQQRCSECGFRSTKKRVRIHCIQH